MSPVAAGRLLVLVAGGAGAGLGVTEGLCVDLVVVYALLSKAGILLNKVVL